MDQTLIFAYLNGHLDAQQRQTVEQWRIASPKHEQEFQSIKEVWQAAQPAPAPPKNIDLAWEKVTHRITTKESPKLQRIVLWRSIAAVAAVAVGLISYFGLSYYAQQNEPILVTNDSDLPYRITLPDGSTVWLRQTARISYPKNFNTHERTLSLEGEAYFKVKHNPEKPFIVESADSRVQVLGTSFSVINDIKRSRQQLYVETGKVAFYRQGGSDTLILKPGQQASFDEQSNKFSSIEPAADNVLAWPFGTIIFNDTPLKKAIPRLEKYFDVSINYAPPELGECLFRGNFKNPTLEEIFEIFEFVFEAEISKTNEDEYMIRGTPCD